MNTIEELFKASEDSLKDHGVDFAGFQRPNNPASVIYYGARSRLHHKEMFGDIADGWGQGNSERVKYYCIQNTEDHQIVDVLSDSSVTADDLKDHYTEMMENDEVYADLSPIYFYFVFDSLNVSDEEEFERWYKEIDYYKALFNGNLPMKSMLILILDESLKNADKSKLFRRKLLELYKRSDCGDASYHIYDSVFVLSTKRNKKGYECFDPNSPKYEENNLLGDLVLLSNTRGLDLSRNGSALYGNSVPAKTIAHGYIEKPNREIIYVALSVIFEKMIEMLNANENKTIRNDELLLALGISNNRSDIVDRIYGETKAKLPGDDFIPNLPNYDASNRSFAAIENYSWGCLSGFLKLNHYDSVIRNMEAGKPNYIETYKKLIKDNLYAIKIANESSVDCKDAYETLTRIYKRAEENDVNDVIESKVKYMIIEQLKPCIEEAINSSISEARNTITEFNALYHSFNNFVASGVNEVQKKSIEDFYKFKVSVYFQDKAKRDNLFKKLMLIGNKTSDMLGVLLDELKAIFSSDDIFKKSYFDELVMRMESRGQKAQELIIEELVNNIDEKILFSSAAGFVKKMEAYFINKDHKSNTLLLDEIDRMPKDDSVIRSVFNTSDDDYAESVWFYDCSEQNFNL